MSHTTKHIALQILLVTIWLSIIAVTRSVHVSSQPFCGTTGSATPGFFDPPPRGSWPAGKTIHVKIDAVWNGTDRGFFEQGIRKWNTAINCSGVTFDDFGARAFPDPNEALPNDTVFWIQQDPQTGFNGITTWDLDAALRTRAARVWIKPGIPNVASDSYFVYLGTHEVGHTFNLRDCLCSNGCICQPERSIMSGQSNNNAAFNTGGPTACDNYAVNRNYCPPCGQANDNCVQDADC